MRRLPARPCQKSMPAGWPTSCATIAIRSVFPKLPIDSEFLCTIFSQMAVFPLVSPFQGEETAACVLTDAPTPGTPVQPA